MERVPLWGAESIAVAASSHNDSLLQTSRRRSSFRGEYLERKRERDEEGGKEKTFSGGNIIGKISDEVE